MAIAVTTVASGGLPVTDVTATNTRLGMHVAEVTKGLAITKGPGGLPVNFAPVADWPGGGGGGGITPTTFDNGSTMLGSSLSVNKLEATCTVNGASGVRSLAYKTSGKYYFEETVNVIAGAEQYAGIIEVANTTYSPSGNAAIIRHAGNMLINGVGFSLGETLIAGDLYGIAVDLDIKKAWFRKNTGLWNNNASHNPATGVGNSGIIGAGSFAPCVVFRNVPAGAKMTANFGATAFMGAVPAGFTSGWPV